MNINDFVTNYPYVTWHIILVVIPTIYLWSRNWRYYFKYPKLFIYISVLSPIWGYLFEERALTQGIWWFNREHNLGINIADIPIEEWFFLFVVPQLLVAILLRIRLSFETKQNLEYAN